MFRVSHIAIIHVSYIASDFILIPIANITNQKISDCNINLIFFKTQTFRKLTKRS